MFQDLLHILNIFAYQINSSRYVAGIMMILMNLGGRYIASEISDLQDEIMGSVIVRRLLIFVVVFIATRDVFVSMIITIFFVILVSGIFNENSPYCILPVSRDDAKITREEYMLAQNIVNKYQMQQSRK